MSKFVRDYPLAYWLGLNVEKRLGKQGRYGVATHQGFETLDLSIFCGNGALMIPSFGQKESRTTVLGDSIRLNQKSRA